MTLLWSLATEAKHLIFKQLGLPEPFSSIPLLPSSSSSSPSSAAATTEQQLSMCKENPPPKRSVSEPNPSSITIFTASRSTVVALPDSHKIQKVFELAHLRAGVQDGISLSPEMKEIVNSLKKITSSSIHHFAKELYSESIHFVLELIQNCNDNIYAPTVVPSLLVQVTPGLIQFQNKLMSLHSVLFTAAQRKGSLGTLDTKESASNLFSMCHLTQRFTLVVGTLGLMHPKI